jgi:hypothetical protein
VVKKSTIPSKENFDGTHTFTNVEKEIEEASFVFGPTPPTNNTLSFYWREV